MSTNGCLLLLCQSADRRWLWHVNETGNKSKTSILKGTPVQSEKALRYCLDYPHNWEDKSGLTQRTVGRPGKADVQNLFFGRAWKSQASCATQVCCGGDNGREKDRWTVRACLRLKAKKSLGIGVLEE